MYRNPSQHTRFTLIGRRAVAALLGALLALCICTEARGISEEDVPSGRLGYTWVPAPTKQQTSSPEEWALDVAKFGGGGLLVLWLLRKMLATE